MTLEELKKEMTEVLSEKPFRAVQLYQWMHKSLARSYEEMTNLPKELRDKLDTLHYGGASIYDKRVSAGKTAGITA